MRILYLGDVMARWGRMAVAREVPELRQKLGLDLVLANAENASGGLGLTPDSAKELFAASVDVLTSGNHIWKHREVWDYLDREERLLRPANYPQGAPGRGLGLYPLPGGGRFAVLNLLGRTYMEPVDCPFDKADQLLALVPEDVAVRLVDFHAEATSEKLALAAYLDGRVSAVLGTHTHVQTSDARVTEAGTACVTDLGMCGVQDSVLGMDTDIILRRFRTGLPERFKPAKGTAELRGAVLDLDPASGKAAAIELL